MGGVSGNDKYGRTTAVVYMFNLIVGIGALALPYGFQQSGILLGIIFLAFIGFLSYITATWIVESQAAANALLYISVLQRERIPIFSASLNPPEIDQERFEINQRTEISLMADLFLGKRGKIAFYIILVIYLFGDLAIYAATVPTSLARVTGGITIGSHSISQGHVYYLYLLIFALVVVPLSLFNFQKTKYLQICTLISRNLAFFTMIILSIIFISQKKGAEPSQLPYFEFSGLPSLFGVSVYAFMCHHSLPSIITPISNKNGVHKAMGLDFLLVFIAYASVCLTAQFAFGTQTNPQCVDSDDSTFVPCKIQSLYTLNFVSYNIQFIADFLALYPVFTLTTNYPLISITLRNNLVLLFPETIRYAKVRHVLLSLFASVTPILIAYATNNISLLVDYTGSYAGLGIQMVIPALLVFYSRKVIARVFGVYTINPYRSFFLHTRWVIMVLLLSAGFFVMVTYNHIIKYV